MTRTVFSLILIIACQQSAAQPDGNALIPYRDGKLWGYCDTVGNIVIKPAYSRAEFFRYANETTVYLNNKQAYIDSKGQFVIPFFENIEQFYRKSYLVSNKGKWGFFYKGKLVVPTEYDNFMDAKAAIPDRRTDSCAIGIKGEALYLVNCITGYTEFLRNITYGGQVEADSREVMIPAPVESATYNNKVTEAPANLPKAPAVAARRFSSAEDSLMKKLQLDSAATFSLYDYGKSGGTLQPYYLLYKKGLVGLQYLTHYIKPVYNEIRAIHHVSPLIYLLIVKRSKMGIVNEKGIPLVPIIYDAIEPVRGIMEYKTVLNKKKRLVVLDPTLCAANQFVNKYDEIGYGADLAIYHDGIGYKHFSVYKVTLNGKQGYMGQNGVEYFKD
jgi:WG containing repeat